MGERLHSRGVGLRRLETAPSERIFTLSDEQIEALQIEALESVQAGGFGSAVLPMG